mmetsp:Transcript_8411/g.12320  ORF Transcript_8411/g.12320 Transcript_8411/m.12320 type:complete len:672 (+) Transcript_8411:117-2132(+)
MLTSASTKNKVTTNGFLMRKENCLGKRDKSSAGRIDPRAVQICASINARDEYYTTSSCSGRCLLYIGDGIKSHHHYASAVDNNDDEDDDNAAGKEENGENMDSGKEKDDNDGSTNHNRHGFFERFRVNHDTVKDAERYFNLSTLYDDRSGGGDFIPTVGQFEYIQKHHQQQEQSSEDEKNTSNSANVNQNEKNTATKNPSAVVWLRFEPFILHVACRSLEAASALMAAARPSFKNVGLTSWKIPKQQRSRKLKQESMNDTARYIVAIWGDEGLDMPLSVVSPSSNKNNKVETKTTTTPLFQGHEEYLKQLVNERHVRNWEKIDRFVVNVEAMPSIVDAIGRRQLEREDGFLFDDNDDEEEDNDGVEETKKSKTQTPKKFDVVGDIAILHSLPPDIVNNEEEKKKIGEAIMERNKAIKVCAVRTSSLIGTDRSPGSNGFEIIAGMNRSPLVTSHMEYGIKCVVDLSHTFFSPRMGQERLRICQQVARGENVLVLFSGIGMDAMQIAGRTEAKSVTAIELNPVAMACAKNGQRMLERNKAVKVAGAAERLHLVEGDVLDVLPTLEHGAYDRIVAPRPKEGALDGDLGTGDGGVQFLEALLPLLRVHGGECHWYDFAADHELPNCERTRKSISDVCDKMGYDMEVIHVARAGSIAMRQIRVCMDFRITGRKSSC